MRLTSYYCVLNEISVSVNVNDGVKTIQMYLKINIENYKHENAEKEFFNNISFTLENDKFTFLIGMSGVGKTTLLKIILGLSEGSFKGEVIYNLSNNDYTPKQIRNHGHIGYLAQEFQLIPWNTIRQNILLPTLLNKRLKQPGIHDIINKLESVGLEGEILNKFPKELSYGMKARVGIVRILLYNPKYIFLDELFTGLDSINNEIIGELLKSVISTNKTTCVAITHNLERAFKLADNILLLEDNQQIRYFAKPFDETEIFNILKGK